MFLPDIPFTRSVAIHATPSQVWQALTKSHLMKQWMSETNIEIHTDWQVGHSFTIDGDWYKTGFENRGVVLEFDPEINLKYSHLSSLSRLPDVPESYSITGFTLMPTPEGETILTVTLNNFPTETIYRHLAFYWNVAIVVLKKFVENGYKREML